MLESLIAEDDAVPDVWYLLGLSLHAGGDFEDALTAANKAERLTILRKHDNPNAGELLLDLEDLKARIAFAKLTQFIKIVQHHTHYLQCFLIAWFDD